MLLNDHIGNVVEEKVLPKPFIKYYNWEYLWITTSNNIQFVFIVQFEVYQGNMNPI